MGIYKVRKYLSHLLLAIVVNTFDAHILSCQNSNTGSGVDCVGHFRNGICDKCHHSFVMPDYYLNHIYKKKIIKKLTTFTFIRTKKNISITYLYAKIQKKNFIVFYAFDHQTKF